MLITLELNRNDAEALLRHCAEHQADSGDFRDDARLMGALKALAASIQDAQRTEQPSDGATETIDPQLLKAATDLFGDTARAVDWLSKPLRVLGQKRPIDVDIDEALALIGRIANGFGA